MPLSKQRNRDRMRPIMRDKRAQSRLQQAIPTPGRMEPLQPKRQEAVNLWVDADGNPVYDDIT